MSVLSLKTPVLVITYGLPGSGKTFFANQFAETFKLPSISYNTIYYKIFDKQPLDDTRHETVLSIMDHTLDELLKTRSIVVVDGNSYSKDNRQKMIQKAVQNGYEHLIVWTQTDEATAKKRSYRKSKRENNQHYPVINAEHFKVIVNNTDPLQKENYVVISGKHNFTTQARMVLRKLAQPRSQAAANAFKQSVANSNRKVTRANIQG